MSAQGLKYGIKAGVNFANQDFKIADFKITPSAITSFHIQGLVDYGISPAFSIQPGLALSGKGYKSSSDGATEKVNLLYVEIPVNAVAKFPISKVGKFFIGAGPYAAFGVSGKATGNDAPTEDLFSKNAVYKKGDFGLNFLGGLEFAQGFTVNANYGLGLSNIIQDNAETAGASIKNKVFGVSVGFLF